MASTDEVVERILTTYDAITVVGASASHAKAANGVPAVPSSSPAAEGTA